MWFTAPITTVVIDTMAVPAKLKTGGPRLVQIDKSTAALAPSVRRFSKKQA